MEAPEYVAKLEAVEVELLALFGSVQVDRVVLVIDEVPPIIEKCLAIEQACQLIRNQLTP